VFNSTKHNNDCSFEENDDLHRLDCVNFFHPCVVVPPSQPNSVNDLHVHGLSCCSHIMYFIVFRSGLAMRKNKCVDGLWNID
jgi:hypothetical protein